MLKESTINKILKRLTHKHQNENKLLYVKGTTEKHFKLLWKDRVATEDQNKIVYEIDCSNCKIVYLGDFKNQIQMNTEELSEIVIVKTMKLQNTVGKQKKI